MAKSQETFSKKEREKKRVKKQQDKAEKMQERKHNNKEKKSLDDMMAYLDENGNLSSVPPDPRKKKLFRQEEMAISIPRQEEREQNAVRTGIVSFFNDHKGFGFINDAETRERVFVHVNQLTVEIKENDKVTYEVEMSHKGPTAVNVALIKS
jgi:cold shock CspA family protein